MFPFIRMRLGLFDPVSIQPYSTIPPEAVNSKEHQVQTSLMNAWHMQVKLYMFAILNEGLH